MAIVAILFCLQDGEKGQAEMFLLINQAPNGGVCTLYPPAGRTLGEVSLSGTWLLGFRAYVLCSRAAHDIIHETCTQFFNREIIGHHMCCSHLMILYFDFEFRGRKSSLKILEQNKLVYTYGYS